MSLCIFPDNPELQKLYSQYKADGGTQSLTLFKGEIEVMVSPVKFQQETPLEDAPTFNALPAYNPAVKTNTYAGIGARSTPANIKKQMTEAAKLLESKGYTLNTGVTFKGKEEGADKAFSDGTTKKNLFSPEKHGSRKKEQNVAREVHNAPHRLKPGGLKLMARNTNQVFGENLDTPVDFVLFYAEETSDPFRPKGGTGQAVEMARRKGIPTINMADSNWKEQLNAVLTPEQPTESSGFTFEEYNKAIKDYIKQSGQKDEGQIALAKAEDNVLDDPYYADDFDDFGDLGSSFPPAIQDIFDYLLENHPPEVREDFSVALDGVTSVPKEVQDYISKSKAEPKPTQPPLPSYSEIKTRLEQSENQYYETEQEANYEPVEQELIDAIKSQRVLPDRDVSFTIDAIKGFHASFIKALFAEDVTMDIESMNYNAVAEQAFEAFLAKKNPNKPEYHANFDYVEQHKSDILRLHQEYLKQFNIDVVNEMDVQKEREGQLEKDSAAAQSDNYLKYSAKETATNYMRLIIASLQDGKKVKVETDNGTEERYRATVNPHFGVANLVDFGETFSMLANELASIPTLDQMKAKLNTMKDKHGVQELQAIIFPKEYNETTYLRMLQFVQTFRKHYNKFNLVFVGEGGVYTYMDTLSARIASRIIGQWNSEFGRHVREKEPWTKVHKNGRIGYNQEWFRTRIPETVSQAIKSKAKTTTNREFQDEIKLSAEEKAQVEAMSGGTGATYKRYFKTRNLLYMLGINITTDVLPSKEFYDAVDGLFNIIKNESDYNLLGLHSNTSQTSGWLGTILQHELTNSVNIFETQHKNADNQTVYNVNLNNYMTNVLNIINASETLADVYEALPHLNNNYADSSFLFSKYIFDAEGNRIPGRELTMTFMEDVKQEGRFSGTPFRKLKPADKLAGMINSAITNHHPLFVPADNSLKREFPLADFTTLIEDIPAHFQAEMIAEGDYFQTLLNGQNQYAKASGFNPSENSMFKDILVAAKIESDFNSFVLDGVEIPEVKRRAFRREFDNYIKKKVEKLQKELEDNLIIAKRGEVFVNYSLAASTQNRQRKPIESYTQSQITDKLTKATLNRAIWNVEQAKLFSGHPLFFGSADNFYKRMSSLVGTKEFVLTDTEILNNAEVFFPRANKKSKRKYVNFQDADQSESIDSQIYTKDGRPVEDTDKLVFSSLVFADVIVESKIKDELAAINKDAYGEMNEADAISYTTLEGYRDLKLLTGDWSLGQEKLYRWLSNGRKPVTFNWEGEPVTVKSGRIKENGKPVVFNALKPHYYGPGVEVGLVPNMYKTGMMPLIPIQEVEGQPKPMVNQMIEMMDARNVEFLTFESANKVGTKLNNGEIQPLFNIKGDTATLNSENLVVQHSFAEHWGIQLKTGTHRKTQVTKGSQVSKLLTVDFYDQGVPKEGADAQGLTELIKQYEKDHERLINIGVEELRKELELKKDADGAYTTDSLNNLINFLQRESLERGANDNVLTGLEYLRHYIDRGLGFEILSNNDKVENILMSIADKRIFSQKMPGGMYVQVPPTSFEDATREVKNKKIISSKNLQMREDGTMEIMIPNIFGEYFTNLKEVDIDQKLLEGLGFRIPTSGMNSIERVVIVGFLDPHHGDVIALPSEIVAKAGSDYDIDKLNVFFKNYKKIYKPEVIKAINKFLAPYVPKDTMKNTAVRLMRDVLGDVEGANDIEASWTKFDKDEKQQILKDLREEAIESIINETSPLAEQFKSDVENEFIYIQQRVEKIVLAEQTEKQQLQNRIIETGSKIITHPLNREIHQESIGTDLFLEQKKYIMRLRGEAETSASYSDIIFDIAYNFQIEQRNLASKQLTGIAALHNTDHTNAQRHGYYMSDNFPFVDGYHKGETLDGEGFTVLLGKLKDAENKYYISSVLNQQTNAAVDGAKDPMFAELNITEETMPVISLMVRAGVSLKNVMLFINQPSVRYYTRLKDIKKSLSNTGWLDNRKIDNNDPDIFQTLKSTQTKSTEDMVGYLTEIKYGIGSAVLDFKTLESNLQKATNQNYMWTAYKRMKEEADKLAEYMKHTRLETTSNKNTSELDVNKKYADWVAQGNSEIINSDKAVTEGFLKPFYEAYGDVQNIFSSYFLHYKFENTGFERVYDKFLTMLTGEKGKFMSVDSKVKILSNLRHDLMSYMVNNAEININNEYWGKPNDHIERLFVGENSIAHRVANFEGDNHLIKNLVPVYGESTNYLLGKEQTINNVVMLEQRLTTQEQNELVQAWRELFETHSDLAADLAVTALLQSGFKQSPISFTKYIPAEIHMEITDSAFNNQGGRPSIDSDAFTAYFYINNSAINDLVPMTSKPARSKAAIFRTKEEHPDYTEVKKSGDKEAIKAYELANKPRKQGPSTIYVDLSQSEEFRKAPYAPSSGKLKVKTSAITDFNVNKSLLYYPKHFDSDISFERITQDVDLGVIPQETNANSKVGKNYCNNQ